jgi:desulfoferrodoxin-like iron-binding protein
MAKRILSVMLAVGLVMFAAACAKKAEEVQPAAQEAAEAAVEAAREEMIYTVEDPGPWAGKEKVHVPEIVYERTDEGLQVTVTVAHEMAPEKPHYIEWIKLLDSEGALLGEAEFQPEDEKAEAVFTLAEIPAKLAAREKCNLHGIWQAEVEVILP